MLTVMWMVAPSVGRSATVRGLLEYFRRDIARRLSTGGVSSDGETDVTSNVSTSRVAEPFAALLRLNFLRAAVAVASILGFVGASILAGFASPANNPQPGLA